MSTSSSLLLLKIMNVFFIRFVKPNSSVEEVALRTVVAHLRSTNNNCSEVYREAKGKLFDEYSKQLSVSRELTALIKKRSDKSQSWTADEEKAYLEACRAFDALGEQK